MTHEIPKEVIKRVTAAVRQSEEHCEGECSLENPEEVATAALQAAIEYGYVVVNQWLPIETSPRDGKFLTYSKYGVVVCEWLCADYFKNGDPEQLFPNIKATHWMPLPNPPTKGDK